MKRYCKNCKFKYWYMTEYCEPWVWFGVRVDDYHSPRHLLKRKKLGRFMRAEQNKKNNCPYYEKKWWKFWVK
ncbi:MAG: hypothetical protein E3J76_02820 [Candidatus Aminicenantes bacterium]|nr:MAG: hypothetical protein E3J76_02820 [Candidatus Aminicenantes bacterium]